MGAVATSGLYLRIVEILLSGLSTALGLLVVSFALAIAIGLLISTSMLFSNKWFARLLQALVEVFRAVPIITQLFIIYFGLPSIGVKLDSFTAAAIGLGINGGAYATEIFRAGLAAVDRGQSEAAQAIGLRRWHVLRHVVIPQALGFVLPPLTSLAIQILKNTAVASAVAAPEIIFRARLLVTETYMSPQIYAIVCLIYLIVTIPMMKFANHLEGRIGVSAAKQ